MKKKPLFLLGSLTLFSFSLFAQTGHKKVEEAIKDPKRAENSAKADVYIVNKQKICGGTIPSKAAVIKRSKKSAPK